LILREIWRHGSLVIRVVGVSTCVLGLLVRGAGGATFNVRRSEALSTLGFGAGRSGRVNGSVAAGPTNVVHPIAAAVHPGLRCSGKSLLSSCSSLWRRRFTCSLRVARLCQPSSSHTRSKLGLAQTLSSFIGSGCLVEAYGCLVSFDLEPPWLVLPHPVYAPQERNSASKYRVRPRVMPLLLSVLQLVRGAQSTDGWTSPRGRSSVRCGRACSFVRSRLPPPSISPIQPRSHLLLSRVGFYVLLALTSLLAGFSSRGTSRHRESLLCSN